MPKLKVDDIEIYYEVEGEGEPLILIAGFGADHLVWSTIVKSLATQFQVITFDNRGSGQTSVPEGPYSIKQMADDVAKLCALLNINKAYFIGSSMGGCILQELAYTYPELVMKAVISNSAMKIQTCFNYFAEAQYQLLKANAPKEAIYRASAGWVFSYDFLSQNNMIDELIQLKMENPYPFILKGYAAQFAALKTFDSSSWLGELSVPTLIISSMKDLIFNEDEGRILAEAIPYSLFYNFINSGHIPHIEEAEQFIREVSLFFSK